MLAPTPISDVRHNISEVFTRVVHGHTPIFVQRGGRDLGVLLGLDEVERLLSVFSFHPEVLFEDEAISIWLPEFQLYGRGASYDEAQTDLVEEVLDYVDDFLGDAADYLRAPNRGHQFGHVMRAAVANLRGSLTDALFAPGPGDEQGAEPDPEREPDSSLSKWFELNRDAVWASPRQRTVLLTVHPDDLDTVQDAFRDQVRTLLTHEFRMCELPGQPGTDAEQVAPLFGGRPAHPRTTKD